MHICICFHVIFEIYLTCGGYIKVKVIYIRVEDNLFSLDNRGGNQEVHDPRKVTNIPLKVLA